MTKGKNLKRGLGGMKGQLQQMEERLKRAQEELASETVEVTAGGAAVRVVMSGTQECRKVVIAPALLEEADLEMIQDLVMLAVNQAIHESQVLAARRLGPVANLMGSPGLGG